LLEDNPDPRRPTARTFLIALREGLPNPSADEPIWKDVVTGTSLRFRLNYRDSREVKDVVVALDFGDPVTLALDRRRLCFRLSEQPVTSAKLREQDARRPEPKTPLIYLHGYEDPDTGTETIGSRLPPIAMTEHRIATAWQSAKTTGYFDPAVFPKHYRLTSFPA
jgi:hypothetical protein